jgi:DNA mismatch repair ATPase MutL
MKVFKNIDEAITYIINSPIVVNKFYSLVRELEENGIAKSNNILLVIDENGILDK